MSAGQTTEAGQPDDREWMDRPNDGTHPDWLHNQAQLRSRLASHRTTRTVGLPEWLAERVTEREGRV